MLLRFSYVTTLRKALDILGLQSGNTNTEYRSTEQNLYINLIKLNFYLNKML